MAELTPIIKDSFLQFAGAVLQSRALADVRDLCKPSARQIFYCLYTDKFVHSKPFQKTLKAIGSSFRMYIHGDSSAEGVIMRAGQPFAMRYPLVEVEGSYGTLLSSGSWAAPRYTSARLSALSEYLFKDIQKNTVSEWRDNYDNTEQYPMVLPSKGFYNLVNGSYGIGIGASSSIPQYNLKELNEALIKLLWNPEIDFEEIYCAPDFATGAVLLNASQVKESHRNGTGFACKLRSVVDFDSKERCFVVSEIPYMLYTETICKELEDIINGEDNPGIDRFNDLTGKTPLIKIYLTKKSNPDIVLRYLFKNTSLQSYYGVNFTMLENGRYPKVFNWKEMLQAHLDHEREVYIRGFQYDLRKIEARLHIIEGLLKAINQIDEVIKLIKSAADTKSASKALQDFLKIDADQAKAILDIKLSRLAHMEVNKLLKEQEDLTKEVQKISEILESRELLNKEIENGLREVANKFGDNRRTRIIDLEENPNNEPIEVKTLLISLTNQNNIFIKEQSTLYTQKRGGVGSKFKLYQGEFVTDTLTVETTDNIMFLTNKGNYYAYNAATLPFEEKTSVEMFLPLNDEEKVCAMGAVKRESSDESIIIFTKQGMMKKSSLSEYNMNRKGGIKAIELNEGDEICGVLFGKDEKVGILTERGQFLLCRTDDVRTIGRTSKGVKAIKLNADDSVVSVHKVPAASKEFVSVSGEGYIKRTSTSEFVVGSRYTKGGKLQKLSDFDYMIDFLPITSENEIVVTATRSQIKINRDSISLLSKNTLGTKSIRLNVKDSVIGLSKF